jgi:hypothetical protein
MGQMIEFFAFWLLGMVIGQLILWLMYQQGYSIRKEIPEIVLGLVMGAVCAFFSWKFHLTGIVLWIAFVAGGFAVGAFIRMLTRWAKEINKETEP